MSLALISWGGAPLAGAVSPVVIHLPMSELIASCSGRRWCWVGATICGAPPEDSVFISLFSPFGIAHRSRDCLSVRDACRAPAWWTTRHQEPGGHRGGAPLREASCSSRSRLV